MSRDDRSREVLAVATLFFVLTWVTVGLRAYVRVRLMKTWGTDDWYMVGAQLVFTIYLSFQITAAVHGTGRHRWNLSDEDARTALLFWYLCEIFYVVTNCLLKFAIGYFYLRIAVQRTHVWCIRILMGGTVLCCIIYFFLVMLQCSPVSVFWNEHPASKKCISEGPTLGISYALAAVNAMADWILGILPFFIVWGLEMMKKKTKILVACILAFAAIGSTGTVIRMGYIHTLVNGPDFLYATTDVAIWSTVEPGIGIAAGSIATFRPLLSHIMERLGFSKATYEDYTSSPYNSEKSRKKRNARRGYRRSLSPSDLVPTELGTMKSHIAAGQGAADIEDTIGSPRLVSDDEVALSPLEEGQIMQTVSVHQQSECPPNESPRNEGPPRLELRSSFRNSFTHASTFSMGKFRIPE